MIATVAVITGKPGTGDQLEPALRDLADATHAEEGCILYSVQRGTAAPDTFVTIEKWRSQEDLDLHLTSPHVALALQSAAPLLATEPSIMPLVSLEFEDPKGTF